MENKIAGWIDLKQDILNESSKERINGVSVNLIISPLEAPLAIRGDYEQDVKLFVIRFKYVKREKLIREEIDKHISFYTGKESNKIHKIEIDVDALNASAVDINLLHNVEDDVTEALESYKKSNSRVEDSIFDIASKAIHNHSKDLFQELSLAK